jgi:homoserine kinase
MQNIRIKSPATTANLGPGYDCLGMALDLWNELEVTVLKSDDLHIDIKGFGSKELPTDENNLIYRSMQFLFNEHDTPIPGLQMNCLNNIPLNRGLGSSSAAIVAGLCAANVIVGNIYTDHELLEMAVEIEGHPDNVAPCIYGGMRLITVDDKNLYTVPIPVPDDLNAVVFIPDVEISTKEARRVLPDQISQQDAVFNMSRVGLLVASMFSDNPEYLKIATQDKMHQPYRQKIFTPMKVIFKGAIDGGATGVFLSGSGSTIIAFSKDHEMTVGYEMAEAARQCSIEGTLKIMKHSSKGAHTI